MFFLNLRSWRCSSVGSHLAWCVQSSEFYPQVWSMSAILTLRRRIIISSKSFFTICEVTLKYVKTLSQFFLKKWHNEIVKFIEHNRNPIKTCLLLGLFGLLCPASIWEFLPWLIVSCFVMIWSFLKGNGEGFYLGEKGNGARKSGGSGNCSQAVLCERRLLNK